MPENKSADLVPIAHARADRIRTNLRAAWTELADAYRAGDWAVLGYSSWADYVAGEFPIRPQLARADRGEVFGQLAEVGMSQREIAAAAGVDHRTVGRSTTGADSPDVDLGPEMLTEAEWRALPDDPIDLVEILDRRNPGAAADIDRKRLRAAYSSAVLGVSGLPVLDADAVASVLTDTELMLLRGSARSLATWVDKVQAARQGGLKIVRGGAS
jgi:hypothetical protein